MPRRRVQELLRVLLRRLRRLRGRIRPDRACIDATVSSSSHRPRHYLAVVLLLRRLPDLIVVLRYPETAADAPVIDYVDDDPSYLSSELPDGGSLEPDATADGCYYVKTVDVHE